MTKLDIRAQLVSEKLLEAVSTHPGLKRVEANPRYTNLSSVRPELLTKALNKMEVVDLVATSLTPQQLNDLCCSISFDATNKIQSLSLSGNNLTSMEPALLAEAVSRLDVAILFGSLSKLAPHGLAIMDALGRSSSRTRHLYMSGVDLASMDFILFAKKVTMQLVTMYLTDVELTPQQATALFMCIQEEKNCLRNVSLDFNKLSSVEPSILVQAMTLLRFLSLKDTGLTRQQVDAIFDALQKPGRLQGLTLSGNNLSFVDPTNIVRVNALQQIMMCSCKLTMKQVISIVAGSLTSTKLKKVRWTAVELDGRSLEWQRLHELFYEATSLGILIFQDTRCPCIEYMQRKHTCT